MMKQIFVNKPAKAIMDVLLVIGFFISYFSATDRFSADSWGSFHCIASMTWYALILVHIGQHWRLTKAMFRRKVMKRNKITFLTVLAFILMTVSVMVFVPGVNSRSMHVHHVIAHLFWLVVVIHAIQKSKRLISLFK